MGVSEIRGTFFWGPYNKDPTIWGAILGSPIFGNSYISLRKLSAKRNLEGFETIGLELRDLHLDFLEDESTQRTQYR